MAPKKRKDEDEIDTVVAAPPRTAAPKGDGGPSISTPSDEEDGEDRATAISAPQRVASPDSEDEDDEKTA